MKHDSSRFFVLMSLILLVALSSLSCSSSSSGPSESNKLLSEPIAYYPFNGNANDESGSGKDGTVNGAVLTADRFDDENGRNTSRASMSNTWLLPLPIGPPT